MAVTQRLQDATGVVATDELGNAIIVVIDSATEPTGSGYAKGCLLINTSDGTLKHSSGDVDTVAWSAIS